MKKVILIGDSIRLSYYEEVAKMLVDSATVTGPEDNCRFSAYTLFNLSSWVPDDDYDVIQWNNGQWDTCYMPDGKIHTPLATYLELQERIASILRKKTKRLIFATTTPVWPEQFTSGSILPRRNSDIKEYNIAATDLLRKQGVEINDLHSVINADIKKYISDDMVHLTEEGVLVAAKCVADMIS
ncbi:SGNH/GDSL hydrolase family protein [bacterium]|nr:SGNH/GDSL hydrolase family protein [bacterium]